MKPRLLDIFCGAGGAAMGYYRAGFEVLGVDIKPQKNFPFEFHQADALTYPLDGFDVVHASPPCQGYSQASIVHRKAGKIYPLLITDVRDRLRASGLPYVIENVERAPINGIKLCGIMFGLGVFRHRIFESNILLFQPEHPPHDGKIGDGKYFSVAGGSGRWKSWGSVYRDISKGTAEQWRQAMGIDWMTRNEIKDSIPPAYTEWIGIQLMDYLRRIE
jgi:DNA (cytosine-5)-methyltransferase 1